MIEIEIGNSYSQIKGLSAEQEKALKKELSYVVNPDTYYTGGFERRKTLLGKRGAFPTGLLARVQRATGEYRVYHPIKAPTRFQFKTALQPGIDPWECQRDAVKFAQFAERGIISMPTGTGKSLVAALLCMTFGVKTLIIVPSLEIKRQLMEDISRYLTNTSFIRIENIDSTALNSLTDFDMLIIDEAHHVAARTYQRLNKKAWQGIYYRFFLTATPFRNQTDETLLFEAIAGACIYKLSYKEAIKNGYIVPVEAYYVEIPKIYPEGHSYREVYDELVVNNTAAHQIINQILAGMNLAGISTLCLVKEVKHGENLGKVSIVHVPFVHGQSEDRGAIRNFNSRLARILIGTTGVLGEGVDTKPCEYVIIAGMGKSKSAFMQAVGRAVRKFEEKLSAKVILIRYRGHKFASRHFNAQKRILLDEYGVVPVKLDI